MLKGSIDLHEFARFHCTDAVNLLLCRGVGGHECQRFIETKYFASIFTLPEASDHKSQDTHNSFTIMSNTIQLQPKQAIPTNGKQSVYLIPLSTKSPSSQFFPLYLVWNGRVRYTKHLHTCTSIRCVISIHVDYKNKNAMPFICMCRTGVHQYSPSLGVLAANSPDHEDSQMSGYHVF